MPGPRTGRGRKSSKNCLDARNGGHGGVEFFHDQGRIHPDAGAHAAVASFGLGDALDEAAGHFQGFKQVSESGLQIRWNFGLEIDYSQIELYRVVDSGAAEGAGTGGSLIFHGPRVWVKKGALSRSPNRWR
ncbi:hypothetical protein TRIP_E280165 [uncultured Spirochaetota bacterium]|uniref:Uncharacterized protein n=1 Tax=uncultured Spirochaetota bacterium TaxID=460511 RepID=A0A652ZWJ8_9SPIR|nr:hypothetical protein TRIP_E280165 [uncultured Spirochaetota bacterium]